MNAIREITVFPAEKQPGFDNVTLLKPFAAYLTRLASAHPEATISGVIGVQVTTKIVMTKDQLKDELLDQMKAEMLSLGREGSLSNERVAFYLAQLNELENLQ